MSTPFEELRAESENTGNVRKTLGAVVFIAPESADVIADLTDASGNLVTLPAGYAALGLLTEDGITFERSIETEEVRALGHLSAVRRDISSTERTVAFTAMEWDKRIVRELADAVDLSEATVNTEGEVSYEVPDTPQLRYYRLLVVGRDGSLDSEVLRAKFYPRVNVTGYPSETWNSTDPVQGEFSFTAYTDEDAGYVVREFLTGVDAEALGYGV